MEQKDLDRFLKENAEGEIENLEPEWYKMKNPGESVIGKLLTSDVQTFADGKERAVYTLLLEDGKSKIRIPSQTKLTQIMETVELNSYVAITFLGKQDMPGTNRELGLWRVQRFTPKKPW